MRACAAQRAVTIGDMWSDVEMFWDSGFNMAVGKAGTGVQKQGRSVTASVNDEGFAKAAECYLHDAGVETHSGRSMGERQ